jgi:hypothetical protein
MMVNILVKQQCALTFAGPVILEPGTTCFDNIDWRSKPIQMLKHLPECIRAQSEPGRGLVFEEIPEFR